MGREKRERGKGRVPPSAIQACNARCSVHAGISARPVGAARASLVVVVSSSGSSSTRTRPPRPHTLNAHELTQLERRPTHSGQFVDQPRDVGLAHQNGASRVGGAHGAPHELASGADPHPRRQPCEKDGREPCYGYDAMRCDASRTYRHNGTAGRLWTRGLWRPS
jgi:hypothetical protein